MVNNRQQVDMAHTGFIAIGYNTCHYAWLLRSNLIRALMDTGYAVMVVAPADAYTARLVDMGVIHVDLPMAMNTNPVSDVILFLRFYQRLRSYRPKIYLGFTIKPNVYGSLAAHALGIPVINNIAGLGAMFIKQSWLTRVVKQLYRLGLSRSAKVFFQNEDDRELFIRSNLVASDITDRLPGSGVDLQRFSFRPVAHAAQPGLTVFLLIARMLWDKGIGEYVEAARRLRAHYPHVEFRLLGGLDVQNPAAISREQMETWVTEGVVRYLGAVDDVRVCIAEADCVVLPSYREGLSRSLLEAAAVGRPIIANDVVGCRDVVDDGVNGFLCRPRDAADLAEKIERMLLLSSVDRADMGRRGREKVEREFDERIVINHYLEAIAAIEQ